MYYFYMRLPWVSKCQSLKEIKDLSLNLPVIV